MKLYISAMLICLCFLGCSESPEQIAQKKNDADLARDVKILEFQDYAESHYPGWEVKGFRKEDSERDGGKEKNFYHVLLVKETKERLIFVVEADFEFADGSVVTKIYELPKESLQRLEEKKTKKKGVQEEEDRRAEAEAAEAEAQSDR